MPRNRHDRAAPGVGGPDDEPRQARGSRGESRSFDAHTTFSDWLAADGAPWRPFDDKGVLIDGRPPVARNRPTRTELFDKACERQIFKHLKAACLWPARDRDKTWRLGDYSSYVLEFTTADCVSVRLRFWSEPDERTGSGTVSFAVSSSAWDHQQHGAADATRTELLRDHGFETARRRREDGQFRKQLLVPGGRAVRALARETIAILCKVFEYDGATPLEFHLHLGSRLSAGFTFDGICAGDMLKLMQRWGFAAAELEERPDQPPLIKSMVQDQPFLVAFIGEREGGRGDYGMIGLRTFMRFEGGVPDGLPNAINTSFATVKASVDEDGDLVVQTPIILHGGVTAENLEMCFKVWRETLEEISEGLEE
ncbi:MAG TPA: YbjN domain-containing protein [Steroidobacteraceae bacterium]|nr:YbjN domain-containing protein [Steroidobacteraceae bacterium]